MMKLELHPLCTLFPRMEGAEFDALKVDIATNGLRQPIVIHDGMILDGGNRYRACIEVGIEPKTVNYSGNNLVSFVLSANLHRRHMTVGQQAAIVASATDWAKAQTHGGSRKADQAEALPLETAAHRAAISGATERTQRDADKLVKEHPTLAKDVAQGRKSLYRAVQETKPAAKQISKPSAPDPIDDGMPDLGDITKIASDLQKETESQQRQIDSLTATDKDAEIVRLNKYIDELNGRLNGIVNEKNDAINIANRYKSMLDKIAKSIGVRGHQDILPALKKSA